MSITTRSSFALRPHTVLGSWTSDDRRHAESARALLTELEPVCKEILDHWPLPHGETVRDAEAEFPELYALVRKRDRLSDSVRIFSAMAVEGFLNYYGVVRLGEEAFNTHFERIGLVPKLRALLLVCDSISVSTSDRLVLLLEQVANGRNALVHPKAKEFPGYVPAEGRPGVAVPDAARQAVKAMGLFFEEFVSLVPESKHLAPAGENGA
ncbi:MAG TPA: hypothetical protein VK959_13275 [Methylophilaceae bacterium]|jgi:hypothetical protein|nr:hypothetical protein [Methylophilaceae bacterium]